MGKEPPERRTSTRSADHVLVVDPDHSWPRHFEAARDELVAIFATTARRIEHIGSTSVPGLAAKPVIDILMVVDDTSEVLARREVLECVGYSYVPEAWPDPAQHLFFCRIHEGEHTHHLHVVPVGSPEIGDYLLLRAYLRSNPDEVAAYAAHKLDLAAKADGDRAAYVRAKPAYVERLLERARKSHE